MVRTLGNREAEAEDMRAAASWKALKEELNCLAVFRVTLARRVQAFDIVT